MVKKIIPETQLQYDEWKLAVASAKRQKLTSDIGARFLYRLREAYYVEDGKLKCKKTKKEVIIMEDLPRLLKEHHDNKSHPGERTTMDRLLDLHAGVPYAEVQKYINQC